MPISENAELAQRIQKRLAISCMLIEALENHAHEPEQISRLTDNLILQHKRVIKDFQKLEQNL